MWRLYAYSGCQYAAVRVTPGQDSNQRLGVCDLTSDSDASLGSSTETPTTEIGAQSGAPADPALADVMSGWAELPPAIRAGILAMIEAAKNEPKG